MRRASLFIVPRRGGGGGFSWKKNCSVHCFLDGFFLFIDLQGEIHVWLDVMYKCKNADVMGIYACSKIFFWCIWWWGHNEEKFLKVVTWHIHSWSCEDRYFSALETETVNYEGRHFYVRDFFVCFVTKTRIICTCGRHIAFLFSHHHHHRYR